MMAEGGRGKCASPVCVWFGLIVD